MSKFDKLYDAIKNKKSILCVGPMSRNCIDVSIEFANKKKIPLVFVASRRQIECSELGGGYVWNTKDFCDYVRQKDSGGYVFLERDHGGPYQGSGEEDIERLLAIQNAAKSYEQDIICGFDIIHIDPSLEDKQYFQDDIRFFIEYCEQVCKLNNKEIIYEVGTESGSGEVSDFNEFRDFVEKIVCLSGKIKFIVGNTGLCLKERENVGKVDWECVEKMVGVCNKNGVYLKAHNVDYSCWDELEKMLNVGIHSLNIAPELGHAETQELLHWLWGREDYQKFVHLSVSSLKWKKWLKEPNAERSDLQKTFLAGHYIFNHPEVIKMRGNDKLINDWCKQAIEDVVEGYLLCLGWKKELKND